MAGAGVFGCMLAQLVPCDYAFGCSGKKREPKGQGSTDQVRALQKIPKEAWGLLYYYMMREMFSPLSTELSACVF